MAGVLRHWAGQFPDLKRFDDRVSRLVTDGFFEEDIDVFINRTPGRLDLMGGNDDYTGGLVFESTIKEATLVAVQPRRDSKVLLYNPGVKALGWREMIEFSLTDLTDSEVIKPLPAVRDWINADPQRAWCAYIVGDLYFLMKKWPDRVTHGVCLYLESDVPLGKGVSSSAALEVAAMKALGCAYGTDLRGIELASYTQWVEIALTESACGIMDQLAVIMGAEGYFVPMLCQPCLPGPLVQLPQNLRMWAVDSGVRHSVAGLEYESARAATFMGYRFLCDWEGLEPQLDESGVMPRWMDLKWKGYLANLSPSEFRTRYEERLPNTISGAEFTALYPTHLDPATPVRPAVQYPVRAATRYATEENWRVQSFFSLISKGSEQIDDRTANLLGELMYQSHVGYTQCGLGSAATEKIVELVRARKQDGLLGAKVTGGGAGGTVAVLGLNTTGAERAFRRVVEEYGAWRGKDPFVFEGSSAGADQFGVLQVRYCREPG